MRLRSYTKSLTLTGLPTFEIIMCAASINTFVLGVVMVSPGTGVLQQRRQRRRRQQLPLQRVRSSMASRTNNNWNSLGSLPADTYSTGELYSDALDRRFFRRHDNVFSSSCLVHRRCSEMYRLRLYRPRLTQLIAFHNAVYSLYVRLRRNVRTLKPCPNTCTLCRKKIRSLFTHN